MPDPLSTPDFKAYIASISDPFTQVRKRNGLVATFDPTKIREAILKAGIASKEFDLSIATRFTVKVITLAHQVLKCEVPSVEDIQDLVEEVLLMSQYRKAAKAFIIYREQHQRIRESVREMEVSKINQYLERLDWKVNENANMAYSLQGLNSYISASVSETYWLNKVYPPELRSAHNQGDIHIHDLSQLSVYCVGWDLIDLMEQGFRGVAGKVASNPPKHFRTALGQIVNFFYTLQGEAAGAQAFSNFDTLLAPFIRYDDLSYKEVKQALQEFVFNVNVPTRVGFQTPFTNVTLDLNCPKHLAEHPVIIGGKHKDLNYGEFTKEMGMFNRAFFEILAEGDAQGRIFTFPIPTINITKDFDWDNPDLESLWEITAKYGIPYFSNFVNSDMDPEDARSMCCRLRIDNTQLEKRGGGLFGAHPLTGSVGVVTINLPRIAYESENKESFFETLLTRMDLAQQSLEIKRKVLEGFTESGLYPYTSFYLRNMKKRHNTYWKNHFSTIGLIGMNEACENLLGCGIGEEAGKAFAEETLEFMRKRLVTYQTSTGNNYNLEATPGEGTTYRLAKMDRNQYPDIICANNDGEDPFYTNSSHLPVDFTDDLFEVMEHQDDLQTLYTGGTVVHLFLGERIHETATVKQLVRRMTNSFRMPYFSLTPTFSVCEQHGYIKGEEPHCPTCGANTEIYSRIVGYLRPINQWNKGKRAEYSMRKTSDVDPQILLAPKNNSSIKDVI